MSTKINEALIIGGSSGIGLATAKLLTQAGIRVTLVGRKPEKLQKAVNSLDGNISFISTDLYCKDSVDSLIEIISSNETHINYLVNAAGYFNPKAFTEQTPDDYDLYMDLNKSLFFISQAVSLNMKIHGGGSIVNIGSM